MKRILAAAMIVALAGVATQANATGLYGGFKGGVNFGDINGDNAPDNTSMRTGFLGGVFIGNPINEQFGLRAEVLYAQKGVKGDVEVNNTTVEGTYKLDYIDIPLEFVVNFAAGDKMGFNIFAGPSFNFNTSAKVDAGQYGEGDIDNIKGFEFGAVIGAGLSYMFSSASFIVDARYSLGATSASDDIDGQSVDVKNAGIGIMAGFSFPLGSK